MISLVLESSGPLGSVALLRDDDLLATAEVAMKSATREGLLPAIQEALAKGGVRLSGVEAIVCGGGPGSFTSLRVSAGLAKGIAAARALPLHTVSSLGLIAAAHPRADGTYAVVTDALRGDAFFAPYQIRDRAIIPLAAFCTLKMREVEERARALGASPIGPAFDGSAPMASAVGRIGWRSLLIRRVEADSWEPEYGRLPAAQSQREGLTAGSL